MFNYDDLNNEGKKKDFDLEETLENILNRYDMAMQADTVPFSDTVS